MSETERNTGKLIPRLFPGLTLEEQAKAACKYYGYDFEPEYDSWLDCLCDHGYREVYIHNRIIYEIHNCRDLEVEDPNVQITRAVINDDDTIDYELQYYNGGGSFDEVLEFALEKIKL